MQIIVTQSGSGKQDCCPSRIAPFFFNSVLGFTGIRYDIVILRISEKFAVLIGTGKNVLFFHYLWINTVQNAKANG